MPKSFTQMNEAERAKNRLRIARSWPADYETGPDGRQSPESVARDRKYIINTQAREAAAIARYHGVKAR